MGTEQPIRVWLGKAPAPRGWLQVARASHAMRLLRSYRQEIEVVSVKAGDQEGRDFIWWLTGGLALHELPSGPRLEIRNP